MSRANPYTKKKKRWAALRYDKRLRNGLCPQCGGKRTGEWITCVNCREKNRARPRDYSSEKNRKYTNKYRQRCRKEGICYGCGTYVGLETYKQCQRCRDSNNKRNTNRYALKCLQDGICIDCKSSINVGLYRKCLPCREKDRIRAQNYRDSNLLLMEN